MDEPIPADVRRERMRGLLRDKKAAIGAAARRRIVVTDASADPAVLRSPSERGLRLRVAT